MLTADLHDAVGIEGSDGDPLRTDQRWTMSRGLGVPGRAQGSGGRDADDADRCDVDAKQRPGDASARARGNEQAEHDRRRKPGQHRDEVGVWSSEGTKDGHEGEADEQRSGDDPHLRLPPSDGVVQRPSLTPRRQERARRAIQEGKIATRSLAPLGRAGPYDGARQPEGARSVDVRIGITQSTKELDVELDPATSRESLLEEINRVLATPDGVLWLTDKRGRRVAVPSARVAYVEVGADAQDRRVGFGAH